jgi:hypothetical protein
VRLRPFNEREKSMGHGGGLCIRMPSEQPGRVVMVADEYHEERTFDFDHAYW